MELTTATAEQFDAFLLARNLSVDEDAKSSALVVSFDFLELLEFCTDEESPDTVKAQCYIALAVADGGVFSPADAVDSKTLIEKGVGRSAIEKTWSINDALSGTDAITMLKRVPMAYNILKPLLCDTGSGVRSFELAR